MTKFEPPDDFLEQLNAQVYGPTTQLIAKDVSDIVCVYGGGVRGGGTKHTP